MLEESAIHSLSYVSCRAPSFLSDWLAFICVVSFARCPCLFCTVLWVAAVGYFARFPRVSVREYDGMAP